MDFVELVAARYSCRSYRPDTVEASRLARVLEAARLAPTACNRQPFKLFVLETSQYAAELGRIYRRPWFAQAPWVIGVAADVGRAWVRRDGMNYGVVDATIAFDHLILAAAAEGLGTCWVAAFDAAAAREVLGLDGDWEPVAFTPLGWPADTAPVKERVALESLVQFGLRRE